MHLLFCLNNRPRNGLSARSDPRIKILGWSQRATRSWLKIHRVVGEPHYIRSSEAPRISAFSSDSCFIGLTFHINIEDISVINDMYFILLAQTNFSFHKHTDSEVPRLYSLTPVVHFTWTRNLKICKQEILICISVKTMIHV